MTQSPSLMDTLAQKSPDQLAPISIGKIIECSVISISKNKVIVDVFGVALGMVPEREFSYDVDDLVPGDKVLAYVLMCENQDGYVILSLKRADRERVWTTLTDKQSTGEPIKVKVAAANRGGLLVEFGGVEGFIPISQLASDHMGGKQEENTRGGGGLRNLVGTTIRAKILTVDKPANKLILSQKAIGDERLEELAKKVIVGTKLSGTVSGIVDFGIFVKVTIPGETQEMEGLVHISEVSWDRVDDLHSLYEVGQNVDVTVIENKTGRLSFSIKRLTPDPWAGVETMFKPGSTVTGAVTRITPFGAFIKLPGSLDGLVHISELGENISNPQDVVKEGESYPFRILSVDVNGRKISLTMKPEKSDSQKKNSEKKLESPTKTKEIKKVDVKEKTVKTVSRTPKKVTKKSTTKK